MKLHSMRRVGTGRTKQDKQMDTVAMAKLTQPDDRSRALNILYEAQTYYQALYRFRRERERCKRYVYGDQWSDIICVDGEKMREEEYIRRQGNVPLKNNLMRRLVRNVIGVYRSQATEPTCIARDRDEQRLGETMSTVLQYNMQINHMNEMYARTMEEFLISGLIVHRKYYGWRENREDCWTDNVPPNNFFIDTNMCDYRGWDCSCLGEIHDIDFNTLCSQYAESPQDYMRLAEIYSAARDAGTVTQVWEDFGFSRKAAELDFLVPRDESRCRVIEVWRKESKPRYRCHDWNSAEIFKIDLEDYDKVVTEENTRRLLTGQRLGMDADDIPLIEATWFIDSYWYFYHLSPQGDILKEGESPYWHKSHPYIFKAYPYIDGEIHSFAADFIDQQRYTNRLITLYDWIMRASAKGVLMIPEDCLPDNVSPEEFSDSWTKFNGVILYKPSKHHSALPQQIANNSTNIGISELLNVQLKFFEDISGVNGALQGKPGYSGTSAALYSQQTQNSTTSLLDLLDTFSDFKRDCAYKDVKNIQQYYPEKRISEIAGNKAGVDAGMIQDVEYDLSIVPGTATPVHRAMQNEFLMQIWGAGQITLQQLLEVGSFPFADALLQSIKSQQEKMQNGQAPDGLPAEIVAQAQQGANMDAVNTLHEALQGRQIEPRETA